MIAPISVLGYGYVAPAASEQPLKLDLGLLERSLRRGLSDVTRLFMHTAELALGDAGVGADDLHVVFGSAFGEIATAEALLAGAYDDDSSSPARFRHSVHNTPPGLLSISTRNRLPSTALAAGWSTVAMGLCEASALLASGVEGVARVLLVFAEEPVPLAISAEHGHGPLGVGFVLSRAGTAGRGQLIALRRAEPSELGARALEPDDHPLRPALDLASALAANRSQVIVVGDGDPPWCVDLIVEERP